jgi:hypothetical protein
MGCDIHMVAQVKDKETGDWRLLSRSDLGLDLPEWAPDESTWDEWDRVNNTWRVFRGRSYLRFGILAGVRSDIEPIIPARGFPADFAAIVDECEEPGVNTPDGFLGLGDHSYSWLSLADFAAETRYSSEDWEAVVEIQDALAQYATTHDVAPADIRLVFGFDN